MSDPLSPESLTALATVPLPQDWDENLAPRLTDLRELVLAGIEDVFSHGTPDEIAAASTKLAPILFRKQTDQDAEAQYEAARLELREMLERAGASFFPHSDRETPDD